MKNYKTIFTILLLLTTVTASYGQSESQESTMELMEREIAHKMSAIYNRSELKNGYYTRRYYTEHQTQSSFKTFVRLFVSENERIQFKGPFKRKHDALYAYAVFEDENTRQTLNFEFSIRKTRQALILRVSENMKESTALNNLRS